GKGVAGGGAVSGDSPSRCRPFEESDPNKTARLDSVVAVPRAPEPAGTWKRTPRKIGYVDDPDPACSLRPRGGADARLQGMRRNAGGEVPLLPLVRGAAATQARRVLQATRRARERPG